MGLILSLDNSIHSFNTGKFVLDQYTGAAAGYSLRRLSVNTTNVIRVRRSSDNAEDDFTADEITDGTLLAWVGNTASDNGFVTTWYDQAGSNSATQGTAASQPKIVDAGVLVEENGKPAVDFDGVDDRLFAADNPILDNLGIDGQYQISVITLHSSGLHNITAKGAYRPGLKQSNTKIAYANNVSNNALISNFNIVFDSQFLAGFNATNIVSSNTDVDIVINGVIDNSGTVAAGDYNNSSDFSIGAASGGGSEIDGKIQEIIIYASDQSSNRTGIETNINNHYNIYP